MIRFAKPEGRYLLGVSAFWRGDLASARQHLEGAIEAYDLSHRHEHLALYAQDPKAVCLVRLAWVDLWAGDAGRADERARSALELAVDLDHLMTLWYVLTYAAIIAAESEDLVRLAELLGDAELLGKRLPSRYLMIVGEALRGWLDVCEGSPGGIERIVQSVTRSRTDGESLHLTYTLLLLARARGMAGELHEGRAATRLGTRYLSARRSARDRPDHPGAQRGSGAGTTTVPAGPGGTARDGPPTNDNSPFARGLETDPVTRALVGEEIGRHDSAAAWTLENPLDWAFLCCRLPDEGAEEIYSGGADILIAAQLGRPLKATSTNGGYRISGRAPFVSNCYDADWISSTVLVDDDETAGGEPEMRMVYFPSEQCEIIDTWDVMGMRGTGSKRHLVTDVYVPRSRTFPMVPDFEPGYHYRGPLYRLPLVGAAASGIPTPMLGAEDGPPARDGPRHEQRRPGGRPRLRHRGNVGVSSHQPAGALLPGCPDDETSRLRL
jgi:hypothetical protein